MNTRTIAYIDENEDILEIEAEMALKSTLEQNFKKYFEVITANYAIAGIDVSDYPVERKIYYADHEQ